MYLVSSVFKSFPAVAKALSLRLLKVLKVPKKGHGTAHSGWKIGNIPQNLPRKKSNDFNFDFCLIYACKKLHKIALKYKRRKTILKCFCPLCKAAAPRKVWPQDKIGGAEKVMMVNSIHIHFFHILGLLFNSFPEIE